MATNGQDIGTVRLTAFVHGRVQGVGFRYLTARKAHELQVEGSAVNLADGTVRVVAEGTERGVRLLRQWLESGRTPGLVSAVDAAFGPAEGGLDGFHTE